jgi:predicted dienelactone hydrolase
MRRKLAGTAAVVATVMAMAWPASSAAASRPTATPHLYVATTVLEVPVRVTAAPADLPTEVWYPATTKSGRVVPDRNGAPFPLVVFSQGFDLAVSAYARLLSHWAAAGFVVAAPSYPYTAPPGPLDEADILNHPAELRSVIHALIGAARQHTSALSGLVNAAEVGLAGHSDGGDVSLAVADNTCCRDPSVKAVAVLSGAELSSFGGTYFTGPEPPLLVVQGSDDPVNVPACSAQIYDEAEGPKYYLDLLGADHQGPYVASKGAALSRRDQGVVASATTDFFQAELAGRRGALSSLQRAGNVPGVARLSVGGRAPAAGGWCAGSPG